MTIYKGKDTTTKRWVYGNIAPHGNQRFIMTLDGFINEVEPESIAVCTEDEERAIECQQKQLKENALKSLDLTDIPEDQKKEIASMIEEYNVVFLS